MQKKEWNDIKKGDVIVDGDMEAEVLVVLDGCFLKSAWNKKLETGYWFTIEEAKDNDWTLKGKVETWKLEEGEIFFLPCIGGGKAEATINRWTDLGINNICLAAGLVFRTEVEAIACAERMLKAAKGE